MRLSARQRDTRGEWEAKGKRLCVSHSPRVALVLYRSCLNR